MANVANDDSTCIAEVMLPGGGKTPGRSTDKQPVEMSQNLIQVECCSIPTTYRCIDVAVSESLFTLSYKLLRYFVLNCSLFQGVI